MAQPEAPPLVFRPGKESDRSAVATLCSTLFKDDYVPDMWNALLQQEKYSIFVSEGADGALVAVFLLERSAYGFWLQGVRVSKSLQRSGIGAQILRKAIEASRAAGGALLAYDTQPSNTAMQKLGSRNGFKLVGYWANMDVKVLPQVPSGLPAIRFVTEAEIDAAELLRASSPVLQLSEGWIMRSWKFWRLDKTLLLDIIKDEGVYTLDSTAPLTTYLVAPRFRQPSTYVYYICFALGDPTQIQQIASALLHRHGTQVHAQVSKDTMYLPALLAAGLIPAGEPWGPEYLFYTLSLK